MSPLLSVRDLRVRFPVRDGVVKAVDGLSFDLDRGQLLAIVGESGSGKSVANLAVLGLHDRRRTEIDGEVVFDGTDLLAASERRLARLRGDRISMIFQDPLTALSPYHTVGEQIAESYRRHRGASRAKARQRAVEVLDRVGIPHPRLRATDYPHQFSGGMRQRVMIAIALVCDPDLLIADEPTTALDVTVQAQILDLLGEIRREYGTAVILVTHDLGLVATAADEVLVMYAGRCVERGTVRAVLKSPRHPYSRGLLASTPRLDGDVTRALEPIEGQPPSLLDPPTGCPFHPRCAYTALVGGERCRNERPTGRDVACHLPPGTRLDAKDRR
ncbi:ABC transporter ATP-binding protein [Dactylosporangium sucinum]|uniref:Peptide ABC transporter ATP-binding protein n=1 Tax=Dactylosporangium sucinum TaxID=1424081 RepID=A0A917U6S1_9ACTN|nr:ABC transporter ATP-binding protein [Dactylosporangium sucinum]GGM62283.1 peptide ABC transporter ATP-binding protein [Dactylosporangium sucinum]